LYKVPQLKVSVFTTRLTEAEEVVPDDPVTETLVASSGVLTVSVQFGVHDTTVGVACTVYVN
jgi:hypothetical protein